ncbi:HNH endonuclease signature motif containing protein, partial [Lentzea nigeriaca]
PIVLGSRSQPLNVGRRSRLFTSGIRRALVARDHGCAFPGCTRPPKHCDAHHIQHWADGGDTSLDNGVLLCRHHHTLIHRSGWDVTIEHGVPVFYPPAWLDPERRPRRNQLHTAA